MTRFLRSHPLLAAGVSLVLLVLGAWLVFSPETDDISDSAMTKTFVGFLIFCVGCIGLLIVVIRPISPLPENWETTRVQGRRHFISRLVLYTSPGLLGLLISIIWNLKSKTLYSDLLLGGIIMAVFTGASVLAASELWKSFERQYQTKARSGNKSDEVKN